MTIIDRNTFLQISYNMTRYTGVADEHSSLFVIPLAVCGVLLISGSESICFGVR